MMIKLYMYLSKLLVLNTAKLDLEELGILLLVKEHKVELDDFLHFGQVIF